MGSGVLLMRVTPCVALLFVLSAFVPPAHAEPVTRSWTGWGGFYDSDLHEVCSPSLCPLPPCARGVSVGGACAVIPQGSLFVDIDARDAQGEPVLVWITYWNSGTDKLEYLGQHGFACGGATEVPTTFRLEDLKADVIHVMVQDPASAVMAGCRADLGQALSGTAVFAFR